MGRDTGYWWSPDDRRIAFTRIDDAPVQEVERFEINADGARMYRQRYPAAGTPNTRVELKVIELASRQSDRRRAVDLARRLPRARRLVSRLAAARRAAPDARPEDARPAQGGCGYGRGVVLLTETQPALDRAERRSALPRRSRPAFIWSSRRSGYKHLYLLRSGRQADASAHRRATGWSSATASRTDWSAWMSKRGIVYFTGQRGIAARTSALRRLRSTPARRTLRGASRAKPDGTTRSCCPARAAYLDLCSSPEQPPTASSRKLDGSVQHWLVRNALDATHPYHDVLARPRQRRVRLDSPRATASSSTIACSSRRDLQAGKRYPVVVDIYGGPHFQYVRKDWMGGARAAQGYFRQVLAQHGFVVFTLDNRGSGFRGDAFESAIARPARQGRDRRSAARRRIPEDAALRRSASASASWAGATAAT